MMWIIASNAQMIAASALTHAGRCPPLPRNSVPFVCGQDAFRQASLSTQGDRGLALVWEREGGLPCGDSG